MGIRPAAFRPADAEDWPRKAHFEYYIRQIRCRYNLNASLDVTPLLTLLKRRGLRFYPAMLYAVSRAVNMNREFRMSFDEAGRPGFWDEINPSYTIFHEDDQTFSDIWTAYDPEFSVFYARAVGDMARYADVKGVSVRPDRPPNVCPMTAVPWLNFTGYSNDTYSESEMLFPIITFGRYAEENGRMRLPFSVFVHHAAADGFHTSKLINDVQALAADPAWAKR